MSIVNIARLADFSGYGPEKSMNTCWKGIFVEVGTVRGAARPGTLAIKRPSQNFIINTGLTPN